MRSARRSVLGERAVRTRATSTGKGLAAPPAARCGGPLKAHIVAYDVRAPAPALTGLTLGPLRTNRRIALPHPVNQMRIL